jgi:Mrp family chromosome partitioning ATPase
VLAGHVSIPRRKIGITRRGLDDFAYLAGRLNAEARGRRHDVRVLVSAPRGRSGTSAVALNVAAGIAGLGRRVVLVDADVRSPGVSTLVPGDAKPGLVELFSGESTLESTLRPLWIDGVRVIPSAVSKPPPQLDVDVAALVLGRLATHDIVVIDGPPLLDAPEAMVLADHVDMVLLVGDLRSLTRTDAARAVELLAPLAARVVGWVTHDRRTSRRDDGHEVGRSVTRAPARRPDVRAESPSSDKEPGHYPAPRARS